MANRHNYIVVDGLRQALGAIAAMPKAVRNEGRRTLKAFAEIAGADARRRVRVGSGKDPHPGRLQSRIKAFATRAGAQVGFTQVPYGGIQEFQIRGKVVKAHARSGAHVRSYVRLQHRHPFLIPAVEAVAPRIQREIGPAIQAALDRVLQGAGR